MKSTTQGNGSLNTAGLSGEDAARAARSIRPVKTTHGLRDLAVLLFCGGLILSGFFIGGLIKFAERISTMAVPSPLVADGIVVLTGGAERISGAVDLLAAGKARRLLISGVHPGTTAAQLARVVDAGPELMACCIDLDRRAANTIGNALEAAKWTHRNSFLSLIVVTSAYHMPRAMLELAHAMPDIRLIPYPVSRPTLELDRWQDNRATLLLMLEEYSKYTATRLRLALGGVDGLADALASIAR